MAYNTRLIENFGGLNFALSKQDAGFDFAVESENVEYMQDGAWRQRYGFRTGISTAMAAGVKFLLYRRLTNRLLAISPGEIATYFLPGGAKSVPTGTPTAVGAVPTPPAVFGTPTTQNVFIASVTAALNRVQLQKFEDNPAPNNSQPSAVVTYPHYVASWPTQNRLAYIGFFGTTDTPSGANGDFGTVFFSDEGAPETVQATNFVKLDSGDGEYFVGTAVYQNQLFIFKPGKVYVFYGVDADDDGAPLFRYRTITLPDPIPYTTNPFAWVPVAVGNDGVYFIGQRGLWRTSGGSPTRVATTVDAIFAGNTTIANRYVPTNQGEVIMGFQGDRLFINYAVPNINFTLIWDTRNNTWTTWTPYGSTAKFSCVPIQTPSGLYIGMVSPSGGASIGKQTFNAATDTYVDGTSNNVIYRMTTGFDDLGSAAEKRVRYVDVWNIRTITVDLIANSRRSTGLGTASATIIGGSSSTERYRAYTPMMGRLFQLKLSGNDGLANTQQVDRVEIRSSLGSPS